MDYIDPELPWGHWLHAGPSLSSDHKFVDPETGIEWSSVRSAFWYGRLRRTPSNLKTSSGDIEFLHTVLAAFHRRKPYGDDFVNDLFGGNRAFKAWYLDWLRSEKLTTGSGDLTDEGQAALLMLVATRPGLVSSQRPSMATVEQIRTLGVGPDSREDRLAAVEREAVKWNVQFLRRSIRNKGAIILSRQSNGPMSVVQTIWTLQFDTFEQRDTFYDWLCLHIDRWPEWASYADKYSDNELTHKLLVVLSGTLNQNQCNASDEATIM